MAKDKKAVKPGSEMPRPGQKPAGRTRRHASGRRAFTVEFHSRTRKLQELYFALMKPFVRRDAAGKQVGQ